MDGKILRDVIRLVPDVAPLLTGRARFRLGVKANREGRDATKRENELRALLAKKLKAQWEAAARLQNEYDPAALGRELLDIFNEYLVDIILEQADVLAGEFEFGIDPTVFEPMAYEWAKEYSYELVQGINETTKQTISDAVARYIETEGATNQDLFDWLEPAFGEVRAEMIAITEVTRAYAEADTLYQNYLEAQGVQTVRVWLTSEDELVCPICGGLNGTEAGVDEWFEFDGWEYENPPAHVNCRCGVQTRLA